MLMALLSEIITAVLVIEGTIILFVVLASLVGWGEHAAARLGEESRAMWRPLTRYLPSGRDWSMPQIALIIGLPAIVLANFVGVLLTAWLG